MGTTITYHGYHHNILGVLPGTTIMSNILGYHHNVLGYYHNEKMSKLKKKITKYNVLYNVLPGTTTILGVPP